MEMNNMSSKSPVKIIKLEIMPLVKVQSSLSRHLYLKNSNATLELRKNEQQTLQTRLEIFETVVGAMTQHSKIDPRAACIYEAAVLALKDQIISPLNQLRAQPLRQETRLVDKRTNYEAPADVVGEEKPKKKKLIVPEELRTNRVSPLADQQRPSRRKGAFVLWLTLLTAAVAVLLFAWHHSFFSTVDCPTETYCETFDRLRCENGGYPVDTGHDFVCKCVGGYYGERCAHETFSSTVYRYMSALIDSVNLDLRRGMPRMWWSFLPFTSDIQQTTIITFYQEQMERMKNGFYSDIDDHDRNGTMTNTRVLPPGRPLYCPVNNALPPLDTVYDEIFRRKPEDALKRDPKRRNMLFHAFRQYFVLQFFDAGFNATVTGSQLYGADETTQKELRSFVGGKLRTEHHPINGHYPPRFSLAKMASMVFSRMWSNGPTHWFDRVAADATKSRPGVNGWDALASAGVHHRWAMGHPLLSMSPELFAMHTLWLREHNRVCDELAADRPQWTDDRLYGAAKRIVVGEMMGIMMNGALNADGHAWPSKHDPAVHRGRAQEEAVDDFAAPLEMLLTMMMPPGAPERFGNNANGTDRTLFGDNSQVLEHGVGDAVRFMVDQRMGTASSNNDGAATEPLTRVLLKMSRENAVQSFNRYRAHLGLPAYGSFYELTGNRETAEKLRSLYVRVDDVEMLPGMLTEKTSDDAVPTFTVMMNSFIVNSIVTNPLYSQTMWTPEAFDGHYGFYTVKFANIRTLVCNNLPGECDGDDFVVDFHAK